MPINTATPPTNIRSPVIRDANSSMYIDPNTGLFHNPVQSGPPRRNVPITGSMGAPENAPGMAPMANAMSNQMIQTKGIGMNLQNAAARSGLNTAIENLRANQVGAPLAQATQRLRQGATDRWGQQLGSTWREEERNRSNQTLAQQQTVQALVALLNQAMSPRV